VLQHRQSDRTLGDALGRRHSVPLGGAGWVRLAPRSRCGSPGTSAALPQPDPLGFSELAELFSRVQVVDLRTAEIAWEGRIEDPARQVEPDTWQIGALGSMVAATDIQRPVFYVDSDSGNWGDVGNYASDGTTISSPNPAWSNERTDGGVLISTQRADNTLLWSPGHTIVGYSYGYRWDSHGYDQAIARFTTTHNGVGPNSTEEPNFSLVVAVATNDQIDVTGVEVSGDTTKTNVIVTDFTDNNCRFVLLGVRRDPSTANYFLVNNEALKSTWKNLSVVGMRQDRFANKLTTAASYTGDYVTVAQVVEDVVGRYLVGGWYELSNNTPWPGSVRPQDVYIDQQYHADPAPDLPGRCDRRRHFE
jgi:hypothetical protein